MTPAERALLLAVAKELRGNHQIGFAHVLDPFIAAVETQPEPPLCDAGNMIVTCLGSLIVDGEATTLPPGTRVTWMPLAAVEADRREEMSNTDFDEEAVRVLSTVIHLVNPQPVSIPNECFNLMAQALFTAFDAGKKVGRTDGLGRAVETVEEIDPTIWPDRGYAASVLSYAAKRIRAEKEKL